MSDLWMWPTPKGGSNRNSRKAIVGGHPKHPSPSDLSLEQAVEARSGVLPRELETVEELPPQYRRDFFPTPRGQDSYERRNWKTIKKINEQGGDLTLPSLVKYQARMGEGGESLADTPTQLPLLAEDSLASHLVLPGSDEARKMTVTSGLRCLELYRNSSPVGCLVRMLLASSVWASTKRYLTWRGLATKSNRLLFRLVPSVPSISESECLLWLTMKGSPEKMGCLREQDRGDLQAAVKMWHTPRAGDWKGGLTGAKGSQRKECDYFLPDQVNLEIRSASTTGTTGGQLNAAWVEILQGFPPGWTDLENDGLTAHGSMVSPESLRE